MRNPTALNGLTKPDQHNLACIQLGALKPVSAAAYEQSSFMAKMTGISAGFKILTLLSFGAQLAFKTGETNDDFN